MYAQFERHIQRKGFFKPGLSYLLAFSSGSDSVVLADLLGRSGISVAIAHCNFNLRGLDSEQDAVFAETFARERNLPFHYQSFDTTAYQRSRQLNTQLAARELRYDWFRQLLKEQSFAKLITAHHANDNLETVLINALRGSGVMGFKGIHEETSECIRPLLPFPKEQILNYAETRQLSYRNDKSNLDLKYERNYLRSKVVPLLKKVNPSLEATMYANTRHLLDWIAVAETYLAERCANLLTKEGDWLKIDKEALLNEAHKMPLLFKVLYPLGFNSDQMNCLLEVLMDAGGHSGIKFHSSTHTLLVDRSCLLVKPNENGALPSGEYLFNDLMALQSFPFLTLKIEPSKTLKLNGPQQLLLSKRQLIFPLKIRRKKTGDRFMPFGMRQYKKLSDFYTNSKLSEFEKEKVWILENGNGDIIWVMGYRNDERYRVTQDMSDVYKLEIE